MHKYKVLAGKMKKTDQLENLSVGGTMWTGLN
jgi:hypothetical protein